MNSIENSSDRKNVFWLILMIWIKPREVIRYILDTNPTRLVLLLASIEGIYEIFVSLPNLYISFNSTTVFYTSIIVSIIFGIIWGIIKLYIYAPLLRWSGLIFKGRATNIQLRTVIAWANIPSILIFILFIFRLLFIGREVFNNYSTTDVNSSSTLSSNMLLVFGLIILLWTIVIWLKSLSEAQCFSVSKAFWSSIIIFPVALIISVTYIFLFRSILTAILVSFSLR